MVSLPQITEPATHTDPPCDTALEPMTPTAGPADDSELLHRTRRLVASATLTLPVFGLAMAR
ncbi:MAG: hypothetical protein K2P78_13075 [Gemmataceae bacterium]|nr:hypothetical protein [Gemmataceae bacterium]